MSRRILGSIAGALATAALVAPLAHAASPAKVSVRVEAPGRTLVDTTLTTARQPVVGKDGDKTHSCTGTSAAGALEVATRGDWDATWFNGLGYSVETIRGVRAPADFSAYWTLWLNDRLSMTGVCDTELEKGDEVLSFLCTATPDFSSCTNLPLDLVLQRVRGGVAIVKVVLLKGDGTSTSVAGAKVRGGERVVTSNAAGIARVTLRDGESALRATRAGDTPSARLHCLRGPDRVSCGSRDRTPPSLSLRDIPHRARFAREDAPRELRGVAKDGGGIADVSFRLTRRAGGSCTVFDGERGRFRPCAGRPAPLVSAGDDVRWSYLLPAKLAPGSYGLAVIATDDAGNRMRMRVRFVVEA